MPAKPPKSETLPGDGFIYLAGGFGGKIGDVHGVRLPLRGLCSAQDAGCAGIFNPPYN